MSSGGGRRRSSNRMQPYGNGKGKSEQDKRVFVTNMAYSTSWQDLKDHMKQAGEVAYCDIIPEKGSTLSSGSGLVEFQTAQMARTAISQLNNSELDGWKIHVREERTGLSIGQVTNGVDRRAALGGNRTKGRGGGTSTRGAFGQQMKTGTGKQGDNGRVTIRTGSGVVNAGQKSDVSGKQIFVGNLPSETTWQQLKEVFSNIGKVDRADIKQARNGASGIVLMNSKGEAAKAIETFHAADFDGNIITVKLDAMA